MNQKKREFDYTREDFHFLRQISNQHTGIVVSDDKFDMFYSRLSRRVRSLGLKSMRAYCDFLNHNHEQEFTEFINAITTNLTSFFRENHHFEYLEKTLIPEILKKNASIKSIKAWSAGCSTGEEAYSIAMILQENVPADWEIIVLATDVDTQVLETATKGIYSTDRISGLSDRQLKNWFKQGKGEQQNKVKVKIELQQLIRFKSLNFMNSLPMRNSFDFIFCRNVLIYFDRETKEMLSRKFAGLLAQDSRLFIGHSESLHQLTTDFDLIGNTIYKKK